MAEPQPPRRPLGESSRSALAMLADGPRPAVLDAPASFSRWWAKRAEPNDRAIVQEAERRGLITRSKGLLFLTQAGKELRADA